jgi:hypothetical protein
MYLSSAFIGVLNRTIIVFQAQSPVFHLRRSTETAAKTIGGTHSRQSLPNVMRGL